MFGKTNYSMPLHLLISMPKLYIVEAIKIRLTMVIVTLTLSLVCSTKITYTSSFIKSFEIILSSLIEISASLFYNFLDFWLLLLEWIQLHSLDSSMLHLLFLSSPKFYSHGFQYYLTTLLQS